MKVIVVGGSIAGCAVAYQLTRAGHDVRVFEQAAQPLRGQGVAVGTPTSALTEMTRTGLLPPGFPHCESTTLDYVRRADNGATVAIGSIPLPWSTMRWSDLYSAIRSRVSDTQFHAGKHVTDVRANERSTSAIAVDGHELVADLVVLADGNRSLGRHIASIGSTRTYTGLALLRGLAPDADDADQAMYGRLTRTMFPGGHAVSYTVPGDGGDTSIGHRDVMWGIYLRIAEPDLIELTRSTTSYLSATSVSQSSLVTSRTVWTSLLEPVLNAIPDSWRSRIDRTETAHLQPVFAATTHRLHVGRTCLIGDAGSVYPPFNANGIVKAVRMASSLTQALESSPDDVSAALDTWSYEELATAAREHRDADRLRAQLIDDDTDYRGFDETTARRWIETLHP